EPCSDVYAIAEYVAVLYDDVTNMDADTEFDAIILRHGSVTLGHPILNFDGTARCVDRTCELNQNAIASPLDNATAMLSNFRLQNLTPMSIEPRQGTFLVGAH